MFAQNHQNAVYTKPMGEYPHHEDEVLVNLSSNQCLLRNPVTGQGVPAIPHFHEATRTVEFHPMVELQNHMGMGWTLHCPGHLAVPWLQGPKLYNLEVSSQDPLALDPFPYDQWPDWADLPPGAIPVGPYPDTAFRVHELQDVFWVSLTTGFGYANNLQVNDPRVLLGTRQAGVTALRWVPQAAALDFPTYNQVANGEEVFQPPGTWALCSWIDTVEQNHAPVFLRMFRSDLQWFEAPDGDELHRPTPSVRALTVHEQFGGWVTSFTGNVVAGQWGQAQAFVPMQ